MGLVKNPHTHTISTNAPLASICVRACSSPCRESGAYMLRRKCHSLELTNKKPLPSEPTQQKREQFYSPTAPALITTPKLDCKAVIERPPLPMRAPHCSVVKAVLNRAGAPTPSIVDARFTQRLLLTRGLKKKKPGSNVAAELKGE